MSLIRRRKNEALFIAYNYILFCLSGIKLCLSEHLLLTVMKPCTLFPSVRCGLEMAILNAIATRQGSNLLGILLGQKGGDVSQSSSTVQICALVDSNGTPTEVADSIATLVEEGFTAVKIKVLS